ncbi:MAG TPA: hypothetical protein VN622_02695 [Clostridia bacterium]|nr:hypothetical protein [Clostridia bacterium]
MMMKNSISKFIPMILALAVLSACGRAPDSTQAAAEPESGANTPVASGANDASTSSEQLPFAKASEQKGSQPSSEPSRNVPTQALTIPSGTPITVRLQTAVSSASATAGDRFEAVLDGPIVVKGTTVAPAGAAVTGRVVAAHRSGRLQDPGMIQIALASITLNGRSVAVSSSSVSARGASHKKRNWAMIGGGAGGGAIVGGLLGGPKGAMIGSAVGAGAGTGTAAATGKKDVGFGIERRLTFRLTQPVTLR